MLLPSKYHKPLLITSLMLNVFLIGGIGGGLYHARGNSEPDEYRVNQRGLHQAMVQLPPERRRELRQLLRQNRADSQTLITDGRKARLEVIERLEAPTLDRAALSASLAKARESDTALRTLVDNTLAHFAQTLPQDEREKLAQSIFPAAQGKAARNKD